SRHVTLRMAARTDQQANGFWSGVAGEMNQKFKNVRIELEQYPGSEYVTKIVALSAGGAQPDVLEYSDVPFFEAAHKGLFLDLDPFVQRDRRALNTDDFFPGVIDFWRWDPQTKIRGRGKLYGLPRSAGTEIVVFNKQVFRQAGVAEPPADGNWTWADFFDRCVKLTERQGDELVRAALPLPSITNCIGWLVSNGAPLLADTTKRAGTLNNPTTVQVLQTVANYRLKDRISPLASETRSGGRFSGSNYDLLARGTYAMILNIGFQTNIRQAFKDDPAGWDIAHMPKGPKGPAARAGWAPFAAGAQTKYQAEAWEFMKFATGPDGQSLLAELKFLPPIRKSVATSPTFADPGTPQHEERWIEAKRYEHFEPLCEVYPKLEQVYGYYWGQINNEGTRRPVNEALRLADEVVNKVFQGGDLPADWEGLPRQ
ncbi:MAG: extracellular solute-binding protein, partial [Chloroflexota bacterium]|nr:extracellular solute-binding protein [Chloroflexota bacterium]